MRTWGGLARVVISDCEREGAVEARAAQMSEPRAQSRSRGASLAALAQLGEQRRSGTVGMDPRAPPGARSKSLALARLGEQRRSGIVGMDPRAPPGARSKSLTVAVKAHRKGATRGKDRPRDAFKAPAAQMDEQPGGSTPTPPLTEHVVT